MKICARRFFVLLASIVLAHTLCFSTGFSQEEQRSMYQRGFYIGAAYSSIVDPVFRLPSGYEEISIPQNKATPGFLVGYHYDFGSFGAGIRAVYWHAAFMSFAAPEMPNSPFPVIVKYTDPDFTHISADLIVQWLPIKSFYLGIYGLLGLASSTKSYTISGSTFPEWDGAQKISEFNYSYGLGLRASPIRWVSLFAEIRWIPGDLTTHYVNFLYSDDIWNYYEYSVRNIENHTKIISGGLTFNF